MANRHDGSSNSADIEAQLPDICGAVDATSTEEAPRGRNHHSMELLWAKTISVLLSCIVKVSRPLWCAVKVMFCYLMGISSLTLTLIIRPDKLWDIQLSWLLMLPKEDEMHEKGASIKRKRTAIKYKLHELSIATTARMGCLVLMWMVINLSVPSLRMEAFLGSLLWKWSLLVALILLTYHLLIFPLLSNVFLRAIEFNFSNYRKNESNITYCTNGLARSITLVVYFTCILLAWLLFIDTKKPNLRHYGTLTLVSLLVGAVLSLVKSVVILMWKTYYIYDKYETKIMLAGCQLYFHLKIMGRKVPGLDYLVDWWPLDDERRKTSDGRIEDHSEQQANQRKIPPVEEFMLKQGARLQQIDSIAAYLTNNFELSLTEDDDIPDIVPHLREKFASTMRQPKFIATCENSNLIPSRIDLLHELLQLGSSKDSPTYEDFEKWMVEGLKNCYATGHRINGAMEVMGALDRVLTGLIIVVVFLVWLFITGFATTRVVVGLGSIFVGLTFMFGETCKAFFQGVIFSFVTHPFDVSDRCIIEKEQLRVKKINILTTSFFGSQAGETVIYPNSELATKRIVILHGEPESETKPKPSS